MCGFAGFFSTFNSQNTQADLSVLMKMGSALTHRGPDSSGERILCDGRLYLAHRRLSILDLTSAGKQPMDSSSGGSTIIFNGEIYNHLEIRDQINRISIGRKWKGLTDTETLIEAIELWGIDEALKKCHGMYSFAYVDTNKSLLILCRDRIGEKPLYYGWQDSLLGKVFLFGSELKPLIAHPSFNGEISKDGLSLYLNYGYVPTPYSIYHGIKKLRPGSYIKLDLEKNKETFTQYWKPVSELNVKGCKDNFGVTQNNVLLLDKLLTRVVGEQMLADVPVGVFLSGGIDSSLIATLMQKNSSRKIDSFTMKFDNSTYDESSYAKSIADSIGTKHHELSISQLDVINLLPELPSVYDEPFADSSQIPTYLISKYAKQHVSVVLSGDGGDEVFAGYNRYLFARKYLKLINKIPQAVKARMNIGINLFPVKTKANFLKTFSSGNSLLENKIKKIVKVLNTSGVEMYYSSLIKSSIHTSDPAYSDHIFNESISEYFCDLSMQDDITKMMLVDMQSYLSDDIMVKVDRATMANSLEARAPFLDDRVISFGLNLPLDEKIKNGKGKLVLRDLLGTYIPSELYEREKMGFALPLGEWLRGPLMDWAESLLHQKYHEDMIDWDSIQEMWCEHKLGLKNWERELWIVLMFQAWYEVYQDQLH